MSLSQQTLWLIIVLKAQVLLITLTMTQFYSNVPVNQWRCSSEPAWTITGPRKSAISIFTCSTCVFSTVTCQNVRGGKNVSAWRWVDEPRPLGSLQEQRVGEQLVNTEPTTGKTTSTVSISHLIFNLCDWLCPLLILISELIHLQMFMSLESLIRYYFITQGRINDQSVLG